MQNPPLLLDHLSIKQLLGVIETNITVERNTVGFVWDPLVLLCTLHRNENPIYVFLFWESRALSPKFHIPVSVSYLNKIFPGSVHIFPEAE
jgi:hypothetical protein